MPRNVLTGLVIGLSLIVHTASADTSGSSENLRSAAGSNEIQRFKWGVERTSRYVDHGNGWLSAVKTRLGRDYLFQLFENKGYVNVYALDAGGLTSSGPVTSVTSASEQGATATPSVIITRSSGPLVEEQVVSMVEGKVTDLNVERKVMFRRQISYRLQGDGRIISARLVSTNESNQPRLSLTTSQGSGLLSLGMLIGEVSAFHATLNEVVITTTASKRYVFTVTAMDGILQFGNGFRSVIDLPSDVVVAQATTVKPRLCEVELTE